MPIIRLIMEIVGFLRVRKTAMKNWEYDDVDVLLFY